MNTNFEYNRFHAQSKIRDLQREGMLNQELKRLKEQKTSPISIKKTRQWVQTLSLKLFRLAFS
ncbi:MAG: hypothetical protein C3F07_02390 [Anaerolineales bacterium]|nr:MAG: hypothetical protein C3F07_02390 [Anaerolineales bacterium]